MVHFCHFQLKFRFFFSDPKCYGLHLGDTFVELCMHRQMHILLH